MNDEAARELINSEMKQLRAKPYRELVQLINSPIHTERAGRDGILYQLEVQAVWDSGKGGDVRVLDDRSLRAIAPLTDDFIKAADGDFVGE